MSVGVYMPAIGKDVAIPQLTWRKESEGEVAFKTTEQGVYFGRAHGLLEGITTYDENKHQSCSTKQQQEKQFIYQEEDQTICAGKKLMHIQIVVSLFQNQE